jgi:hypothetical protein
MEGKVNNASNQVLCTWKVHYFPQHSVSSYTSVSLYSLCPVPCLGYLCALGYMLVSNIMPVSCDTTLIKLKNTTTTAATATTTTTTTTITSDGVDNSTTVHKKN